MNIKPCPFCGNAGKIGQEVLNAEPFEANWWVRCDSCGVQTPVFDSEESALSTWNRRTSDRLNVALNFFEAVNVGCTFPIAEADEDDYGDG